MAENSEFAEEQTSERPDVRAFFRLVRRRHMHFLIPLLAGWLIVWGASWMMPARYKSTTLILVEQPSVPSNYVQPNVTDDLQDRLQSITQQILSRTRLLSIIEKLHLYGSTGDKTTDDDKVDLMRKDIAIDLVHSENQKGITGFTIGFSTKDPRTAQSVTAELADLFIGENLKARQEESEGTTEFIQTQLDAARASLAEQEAKVGEYEGKHEGVLPTQQASNIQILSGLQSQLQNEQDALNTAKQQGIYLQSLIEQYRALSGTSGSVDGSPTDLPAIDQELTLLRAKLADLSSHYTDRYPDVQNLKIEIAKTEKMRSELLADLKDNDKGKAAGQTGDGTGTHTAGFRNSPLPQLESQLQVAHAEVASREKAIASLEARVGEYQGRLNAEPASEQELRDLNRGYEQSKANYDDLLKKKNESAMATSMEQRQQGERFSVLDPPSLPTKPDSPNRLKLCGIGFGAGLGLGLIVVMGFEMLDDRLYSDKEIKALLPVAILSEIPEVEIPSDARGRRRKMILGWATATIVVTAILTGSTLSFLSQ